ncbi:hypothetical protein SAMN05421805_1011715 [Saccharopolyspora antimicrobica]|uniref:Syndecan 1 n=1 Tax=Saccharopolyspora antimicrobica TaxID=455193 RepID=A0A1I4U4G6_9PSEU|nr:hypothetical protein ATL45_7113 [Saccharopolyspora antimicrobica]SFM83710.1 hypothetical protein SAMN05421805_1011715 [Saccharopolyspora antimicrobica]
MGLLDLFRRRRDDTQPAPDAAVSDWDGGWRRVARDPSVLQRASCDVTGAQRFRSSVASFRDHGVLTGLGHRLDPGAPAGILHGLIQPVAGIHVQRSVSGDLPLRYRRDEPADPGDGTGEPVGTPVPVVQPRRLSPPLTVARPAKSRVVRTVPVVRPRSGVPAGVSQPVVSSPPSDGIDSQLGVPPSQAVQRQVTPSGAGEPLRDLPPTAVVLPTSEPAEGMPLASGAAVPEARTPVVQRRTTTGARELERAGGEPPSGAGPRLGIGAPIPEIPKSAIPVSTGSAPDPPESAPLLAAAPEVQRQSTAAESPGAAAPDRLAGTAAHDSSPSAEMAVQRLPRTAPESTSTEPPVQRPVRQHVHETPDPPGAPTLGRSSAPQETGHVVQLDSLPDSTLAMPGAAPPESSRPVAAPEAGDAIVQRLSSPEVTRPGTENPVVRRTSPPESGHSASAPDAVVQRVVHSEAGDPAARAESPRTRAPDAGTSTAPAIHLDQPMLPDAQHPVVRPSSPPVSRNSAISPENHAERRTRLPDAGGSSTDPEVHQARPVLSDAQHPVIQRTPHAEPEGSASSELPSRAPESRGAEHPVVQRTPASEPEQPVAQHTSENPRGVAAPSNTESLVAQRQYHPHAARIPELASGSRQAKEREHSPRATPDPRTLASADLSRSDAPLIQDTAAVQRIPLPSGEVTSSVELSRAAEEPLPVPSTERLPQGIAAQTRGSTESPRPAQTATAPVQRRARSDDAVPTSLGTPASHVQRVRPLLGTRQLTTSTVREPTPAAVHRTPPVAQLRAVPPLADPVTSVQRSPVEVQRARLSTPRPTQPLDAPPVSRQVQEPHTPAPPVTTVQRATTSVDRPSGQPGIRVPGIPAGVPVTVVQRDAQPAPARQQDDAGTRGEPDVEELARRLIEPVGRLLRAEFRHGRERIGRLHDRRR